MPAGAAADRGARVVGGLPSSIEVPQRPELVGGIPRVERERVDGLGCALRLGTGDVAPAESEHGDRLGRRLLLGPLHGGVLDRRRGGVAVPLDAQLHPDRPDGQPPGGIYGQVGWGGPQQVPHRQVGTPAQRAAAPVGLGEHAAGLVPACREDVAEHPDGFPCAEQTDQPYDPDQLRHPAACGCAGELDELAAVTGVRHRIVRHQQVVHSVLGDVHPQGRTSEVGLEVRFPGVRGVGEPDGRPVRRTRLREPVLQVLGEVLAKPQLGVFERQRRFRVKRPGDTVRHAVGTGLSLRDSLGGHDGGSEGGELSALGLGTAAVVGLGPPRANWPGAAQDSGVGGVGRREPARQTESGHEDRNLSSSIFTRPGMTPSGEGL